MINFEVDVTGMDEILRRLSPGRVKGALTSMVNGLARLLLRYAQIGAPVRTGNLRRAGFMLEEPDGMGASVGFGAGYAGVVEGGSQAHIIAAKNATRLAFVPSSFTTLAAAEVASGKRRTGTASKPSQSLVMFRSYVSHPGTVPNPFLQTAWEDSKPDAAAFIAEVGSRFVGGDEPQEE